MQPFRSIRYLGNKRRLLPFILDAVEGLGVGGPVLDLFAGTNVVAGALARRHRVATNDIQKFSWVLAKALLGDPDLTRTRSESVQELGEGYAGDWAKLCTWLNPALEDEQTFLEAHNPIRDWQRYASFCADYPHFPLSPDHVGNGFGRDFLKPFRVEQALRRRRHPAMRPYLLFSTYYANAYFGVRQSLQIDCLRCAIDHSHVEVGVRYLYLAALIYAASASVSAIGHFAQFRRPHSRAACDDLLLERRKDIWVLFQDFVEEVFSKPRSALESAGNYNTDYRNLLRRLAEGSPTRRPSVVYADPPYFRDQYSRYYHVLETLVRYDYPDSTGVGRYRGHRPSSGFSKKSTAGEEFNNLAVLSSRLGADLVVSYCDNAILPIGRVKSILRKAYHSVSSQSTDYLHSAQGRSDGDKGTRDRSEYLFTCTDPRSA